jgi:hypothetical protein
MNVRVVDKLYNQFQIGFVMDELDVISSKLMYMSMLYVKYCKVLTSRVLSHIS